MNEVRRDANDKIITTTKQLINEIVSFSDELDGEPSPSGKSGGQQPSPAEPARRNASLNDDGYAETRISSDSMKVTADFFPPLGTGRPLDFDMFAAQLKRKNIRYGVEWDAVRETILFCNKGKTRKTGVLIAQGKLPIDEIPSHYAIDEFLLTEDDVETADGDEVDHKEKSPFKLVNRGQVLAKKVPGRPGELGYNVFGSSLAYKTKSIHEILSGDNVRPDKDVYIANCDGLFQFKGSKFWVDELLFIDTDVDYKTGHIDFPGDILIKGTVKDGFTINGGKSIVCQSTLDASAVTCQGDLFVQNGIIGKKEGIVKVGGKIRAKFIENCRVESRGSVEVKKSIVQSNLSTLDKVSLGDRGSIIGGVIYAQMGVEAKQIGNPSALRTEIFCGVDFNVQTKLEWVKAKNLELAFKQKEIQNRLGRSAEKNEQLAAMTQTLKAAINKLNEAAKTLLFHLDKNEEAKIVVRGVVYPGTIIDICRVRYTVTHVLPRVVFSLNRRKGKIEVRTF
jgi:uncharacterized protein (DUF342 family)